MKKAGPMSLLVLVLTCSAALPAADWPRFRGASGSGISEDTGLPVQWGEKEGVLWKAELPGPGSSSPITSKGRVFVTCYSGYGVNRREPGDQKDLRRHVLCVDSKTGKILWDRSIESKLPEERFQGIGIPNHGYASSTPAADGERVYAFFGRTGVIAHDFEGKELWRAEVAPDARTHGFGTASSVVLVDDLVIVPASVECEALVAFDKLTGKETWRAPVTGYDAWWSTPIPVKSGDQTELVINLPGEIWGLNPRNGKLRWHADSFPERGITPSPVIAEGVAYAIGGRNGGAVAVKLGGRGDITKSNVVWNKKPGSYITSPVAVGGVLYWVNDQGILNCLKVESGEEASPPKRLEGSGSVYASLVVGEGRLYAVTRRNGTFVLEAKPELKVLAQNKLAGDETDFSGSPAISDGNLFLRSDRALYCIGKGQKI